MLTGILIFFGICFVVIAIAIYRAPIREDFN